MLKGGERIPKEEAHTGDGEADGATVSAPVSYTHLDVYKRQRLNRPWPLSAK